MSKQFWTFLGIGLAIVAIGIGALFLSTKGAHLDLKGEILKVRVLALSPETSLVIVDFRVANPSDVPFVVQTADLQIDPYLSPPIEGKTISKPDTENVFKYEKLLGPKYNDVLSIEDKIAPHQTMDRMIGARFEAPESAIDMRKDIRLHIEDMDGTAVDVVEKKK